ncbi:glycosyltransferase [Corynebacterium incognita]|uniref:Glycosyltransferase n=1 Tax=Corynebacterium incognita TaxID=2754725 RepID=A0A7G7CQT6_9CORY|nr:glycosyltransferase [Corynebacterium incognita]QNE89952.1 glycosyltransferase [Corynebacterium incognita]
MNKALVYGDISPNVIDGSSVWLMSITEIMAGIFDEVHLQLKMVPQTDKLLDAVIHIDNVIIHYPPSHLPELEVESVVGVLENIVEQEQPSVLIARGLSLCNELSRSPRLAPVLWSYITDLPFPLESTSENNLGRLNRVALRSRKLFVQTEAARSYLEALTPAAAGKTHLMYPMIPSYEKNGGSETLDGPLKIVYSGKMAKDWKTLEMLAIPRHLRELGIDAELYVIGDKINKDRNNPQWANEMKRAIVTAHEDPSSGVTWLGSMPRKQVLEQISSMDIGLGWRTEKLDYSLEISTKFLEYSSLGIPTLLNRTLDMERMLGVDYPFFTQASATSKQAAQQIAASIGQLGRRNGKLQEAVKDYSMSAARERLHGYFLSAGAIGDNQGAVTEPLKMAIVSHDFKFMGELVDSLSTDPNFILRQDAWDTLRDHDEKHSLEVCGWADVVFCEFAGPFLNWYAQNKRPGQKLITRMHGFEVRGPAPWLLNLDFEQVDEVIFVSEHYRRLAVEKLGISRERTRIISNTIDTVDFDRPKMENAQFNLGLVGFVPFLKRPDRAIKLLSKLIEVDPRYNLRIRGRAPWEYPYVWKDNVQRSSYLELFQTVAQNSELKSRIVFEDFGSDISSWFRSIGVVLSPSENESFHLAPAEGMASRAVPVVWDRDGARDIFGHYVVDGTDDAVDRVLNLRDHETFCREGRIARDYALQWGVDELMDKWRGLFRESH